MPEQPTHPAADAEGRATGTATGGSGGGGRSASGSGSSTAAGSTGGSGAPQGADYTQAVIDMLRAERGDVRRDDDGEYFYGRVSSISLHSLLRSALPPKEVLWGWYDHFDRLRGESIYATLPPLEDERVLEVLAGCGFEWDVQAVRDSGYLFLRPHRTRVFGAIVERLEQRLEAFRAQDDATLSTVLKPRYTWSEVHLRRQVSRLQRRPLEPESRRTLYEALESDYLRATARHQMDRAATAAFWKEPPEGLDRLRARFDLLYVELTATARRLGVYVSREDYEAREWQGQRREQQQRGDQRRRGQQQRGNSKHGAAGGGRQQALHTDIPTRAEQFAVLGLEPSATLHEVRSAYREKVKDSHPDRGGTVRAFLEVQEAYEFLVANVYGESSAGAP